MSEDKPLFEGKAVTIWQEPVGDDNIEFITVRVGMTTLMMPHSIFLELITGTAEAQKKLNLEDK